MSALGVFATTVVTAVTAQNTAEVTAVHPVPTDLVGAQLDAVLDDFDVRPVKTGMLATTATVRLVADRAAAGDLPALVVDPVMVASTGRRLLDDDAVATYRDRLVPQALLVTPNLFEAAILAGVEPTDGRRRRRHGRPGRPDPRASGPTWVLVKGGHLPGVHDAGARSGARPGGRRPLRRHRRDRPRTGPGGHPEQPRHGLQPGLGHRRPAGHRARRGLGRRARPRPSCTGPWSGAAGWDLGRGHGPLDPFGWSRD